MSRKQPNPEPPDISKKPPPPSAPPPCRKFKESWFFGTMYETEESKQATRDWLKYIKGYGKENR